MVLGADAAPLPTRSSRPLGASFGRSEVSDRRPLVLIDATPLRAASGFRGIGRYVRDLLLGLAATHEVWQDALRIEAIEDIGVGGRFVVNRDMVAAADAAFAARGTRKAGLPYARRLVLGRGAARAGASLLHITEALGTPIGCSVPRLVTCHDMIEQRYPEHYLKNPLRALLRKSRDRVRYAAADQIVAISQRTADDVIAIAGVQPERVHIVLHGVDLASFGSDAGNDTQTLQALGVADEPYVFYAGGADWRKNVDGMLAALAAARRTVDMKLVWAGSLGPKYVQVVRSAARAHGVDAHVRLLGFVSEEQMPALFRRAVAHLFLSRLEGFGLSVVEAMAAGCPVIVAKNSQSDEIAGGAGLIVSPDDPVAAGRAITELAKSADARRERAALGQARALYFDRNRMAKDYAALYAQLTASR